MSAWLRRLRGAVLMGVIWAVVWSPIGPILGSILDPDGSMDEPWIAVGIMPGFLAGVVFSIVLSVAARRRKLRELSIKGFGVWGAIAGLIIASIPMFMGDWNPRIPNLRFVQLAIVSSLTILSAGSAAASFALARRAEAPELAGADRAEIE